MRVLIAGGGGFVGSHLARHWHGRGADVVVLDNFLTSSVDNLTGLLGTPRFRLVEGDVTDPEMVGGLPPVDVVYHLASAASPDHYQTHGIHTLLTNSVGTLHLVELALRWNARFVITSTSEVYGDPLVHPQPEGYWGNVNPVGERACYDEGKRFAEALVSEYVRKRRLNAVITRLFNTYGPRMGSGDGRMIPNFITAALAGSPLMVHGDGQQTRSLCYVDDLVEALSLCAERGAPGLVVNLGNDREMTVAEIARMVLAATGSRSPLEHVPPRADDPNRRRPDISRAKEVLGWQPRTTFELGLGVTIRWFAAEAGRTPPTLPNAD